MVCVGAYLSFIHQAERAPHVYSHPTSIKSITGHGGRGLPGLLRGGRACSAAAGLLEALDDVVDAGGQRLHVGRVHRGEHADPQAPAC